MAWVVDVDWTQKKKKKKKRILPFTKEQKKAPVQKRGTIISDKSTGYAPKTLYENTGHVRVQN